MAVDFVASKQQRRTFVLILLFLLKDLRTSCGLAQSCGRLLLFFRQFRWVSCSFLPTV